jgi:CHAT domain-containing protein
VGNPDFRRAAERDENGQTDRGWVLDEAARSVLSKASRGIEFGALPGTKEEVENLVPKLTSAGFQVRTLSGNLATEANLASVVRSPELLHLATHGFFLPSLPMPSQGPEGAPKSGMLLSGLALTGAQNTLEEWGRGRIPLPGNDGILLASEIANLDLGNTHTVVLSACETAVGKTLSGEGVEGLRSGLTLAGARNVVLTLWPVDDAETVTLMNRFYDHLLAGNSPASALNEAKRERFETIAAAQGLYLAHRLIGPFLLTRTGSE